jgi:translocation and assembly module TamB
VAHRETRLRGTGWLHDWNSPTALFHMSGNLAVVNLSMFAKPLAPASADISVLANFHFDERGFHATGKFAAPAGAYRGVRVSNLSGFMEIAQDVLYLRDVQCRLRQGEVNADAEIPLRSSNPRPNRFQYKARGVEFRDGAAALQLPGEDVENRVDSEGLVLWRGENLEISGKADVHPINAQSGGRGTGLQGRAEFRYRNGTWYLPDARLRSPRTSIDADGQDGRTFHIRVATTDVGEPLLLLRSFLPPVQDLIRRTPDLLNIKGTYRLNGDVVVVPGSTSYAGTVAIDQGRWRTYVLDSLEAMADFTGSRLALRSLKLRRGVEAVEGNASFLLPQGEARALSSFDFRGSVRDLSLQTLDALGIGGGSDVTGTLTGTGSVSLSGTAWSGTGSLNVARGSFRGELFDTLRATARLQDGVLFISDGEVSRGAARVSVQGHVQANTGEMELATRLYDLPLTDIPEVREKGLDLDGLVTGSGQVSGTADNPGFSGTFQLSKLRYGSLDLGHGSGTVRLRDRNLSGSARVESEFGGFAADASVSTSGGFPGKAVLDFTDWNIQRLIAAQTPPFLGDLSTALRGRVEVEGKFADRSSLSYRGEVDGARFKIHDYDLRNQGKMRFTGTARKLQIAEARILGDGTDLALGGEIPLDGSQNLNLRLNGTLSLAILERLERKLRISGSTTVDVRATGSVSQPQVIGQSLLQDARIDYSDLPFRFAGVRGRMVFSRDLVRFENIEGSVATGTIQLSGAVEHAITEVRGINLQATIRKARVPYPKDFRSTIDADLVLRGGPDSQVLTGDVNVLRSDYLKDISLLEQFAGHGAASSGPLTTEPLLAGMGLNVSVHSEGGLYIDNETARLRGRMRLSLRGTPAYPSLTGRVEAIEGSIYFRGNRFDLVRAGADFVDRNRINPVLDLRAEADVKSYSLILDMTGDLDHLTMNLSSVPALSTVDIVSLLTTGKSSDVGTETSRRQAEITGLSAASILSESLTGVIGKRVQRIFGLESFRVDPFLAGAENDPTARVTITERISRDLTVTISRNLTTSEEQIVVLEYDVTRNMTVVATRDENGQFGLDFRFRKRFR